MHRPNTRELLIMGLMIAAIAIVVSWTVVVRVVPRTVVPIAARAAEQAKQLR